MQSFVSFYPTPHEDIANFFELAPVSAKDVVYDLGSGDGRLVFAALNKGAGWVVGVEMDTELNRINRATVERWRVADQVTFLDQDIRDVNLTEATVVLCYLSVKASAELKSKFEAELKPGTRVVMEDYPVPGWQPVRTIIGEKDASGWQAAFYLYIMPPQKV